MGEGYRPFDHTGDLGLEIWADTPERLYALAAEAVLAQVAEALPGPTEVHRTLELEGDDPGELLIHWLNTALLEAERQRVVWIRASVRALDAWHLSAALEGQRLDPRRQVMLREVKAVSHHELVLDLERRPCTCRLVLDL
jgi:SHS2 domain-containing protein